MHAAREVGYGLISVVAQVGRHLLASLPRTADAKDGFVFGDLFDVVQKVGHRYLDGISQDTLGPLLWLANVEQHRVVGVAPRLPLVRWDLLNLDHRWSIVEHACAGQGCGTGLCTRYVALHSPRPNRRRISMEIAVLASGSGTNLQTLIDTPAIRPRIAVVVSDMPDSQALNRARAGGIATSVVRWSDFESRDAFSRSVAHVVMHHGAKGVVLAGFMRILSPVFIDRFPNRILNVHPSLLPAFPGADAVESALEQGVSTTGVTVHLVDEKVDHGPIIAQRPVPIERDDSVDTLHARIQIEEHDLYPQVVASLVNDDLSMSGDKVVWK